MLPQTRQKLRLFSFVAIGLGVLLIVLIWTFSEPDRLVTGATVPSFWEVLLGQPQTDDAVQWKLLDMTMSWQFFSNLLRLILLLTCCTAGVCLAVVYSDIKLTKK